MPMRLIFRQHAIRRMFERSVTVADVELVLTHGRIIEDYPTDTPYPSRLWLGQAGGRNLHVVAALAGEERIIVTVYEPDPALWSADFSARKKS